MPPNWWSMPGMKCCRRQKVCVISTTGNSQWVQSGNGPLKGETTLSKAKSLVSQPKTGSGLDSYYKGMSGWTPNWPTPTNPGATMSSESHGVGSRVPTQTMETNC